MNDLTIRRRDLGTQIGSSTLTLGAIVGIAVGGAVLLFAILVTIGIVHVKKKHRLDGQQLPEAKEHGHSDMDFKAAILSTQPPEAGIERRLSFHRLLPQRDGDHRYDWAKQSPLQRPAMVKSDSSCERRLFWTSSVRDSWPLMSNGPLGYLPGQSTMLGTDAPGGYVAPDQQWPHRTSSRLGRMITQKGYYSAPPSQDGYPMFAMPHRRADRRSTSESQLTTILRSTSLRLKESNRQSLTRTLSSFGEFPGLPPLERLPTPPMRQATESCEVLLDHERNHSQGSSVYEMSIVTPSIKNNTSNRKTDEDDRLPEPVRSPAPSAESPDSLFMTDVPDLVIPTPLTSPSKSGSRSTRRHTMRTSSDGSKDMSMQVHDDNRESLFGTDPHDVVNSNKILAAPQRISLASDPFSSSVRSSKPVIPNPNKQASQPMYFRKATFGQEATPERPADSCSPLRDVSGNGQSSSKRALPEPPARAELNPFQWSPKDAIQTRVRQASPKRNIERKKGHKRSNVVRMSKLSRPSSTVEVVHEEPEEISPLKFNVPKYSSFQSLEPIKSPSRDNSAVSSRRPSVRPPTLATFNPTVVIAALSSRSADNSPTLGTNGEDGVYSPTLSVCNYYSDPAEESEDEFFNRNQPSPLQESPSTRISRRHGRNDSTDLSLFPTHQSQQNHQEQLLSFPPLPAEVLPGPMFLPPRGPRPLPNISPILSSLRFSATGPTPPLLAVPVPSHPNGPRLEPSRHSRTTLSPPRESMVSTVMMLRRMNSEVSIFSSNSHASLNSLPDLPLPSSGSSMSEIESRGRSRGSENYLALGRPVSKRPRDRRSAARSDKRDSHRVYKERRKKRAEEHDGSGSIDDLTLVPEGSSPASASEGREIIKLQFPALSHESTSGITPPRKKSVLPSIEYDSASLGSGNPGRWSDAMSKPTSHATRHESKMEYPSPQTPSKWKLSGLGLAGVRLMDEDVDLKGVSRHEGIPTGERPDSLGFYDQDGFLKASPDRERILKARAREENAIIEGRESGSKVKYSGFVM